MLRRTTLFSAVAALVCLSSSALTQAGRHGCGCSQASVHYAPLIYAAPEMAPSFEHAATVQSCCGVGGGIVPLGSLYGSAGFYGYSGIDYGSRDPRSFESGFENLPNMDGGGVHSRLPFHSYRRPWAQPGVVDNSINIVW